MLPSSSHSTLRRKRERHRRKLARCTLVVTALFVCQILSLNKAYCADNSIPNLKLYAYNAFKTYDQFDCYNYLITRESRWNYKAKNGSHYGLAQMRNQRVLLLTPKEQIVWSMRYIGSRYGYVNNEPNACMAAEHLDRYGWH